METLNISQIEVLLNKKAYEIYTGQKQDEEFKVKVLKSITLTEKEIRALNLTKDSEQKVFTVSKEGIGRVIVGNEITVSLNKYLSDAAIEIGTKAAGRG